MSQTSLCIEAQGWWAAITQADAGNTKQYPKAKIGLG